MSVKPRLSLKMDDAKIMDKKGDNLENLSDNNMIDPLIEAGSIFSESEIVAKLIIEKIISLSLTQHKRNYLDNLTPGYCHKISINLINDLLTTEFVKYELDDLNERKNEIENNSELHFNKLTSLPNTRELNKYLSPYKFQREKINLDASFELQNSISNANNLNANKENININDIDNASVNIKYTHKEDLLDFYKEIDYDSYTDKVNIWAEVLCPANSIIDTYASSKIKCIVKYSKINTKENQDEQTEQVPSKFNKNKFKTKSKDSNKKLRNKNISATKRNNDTLTNQEYTNNNNFTAIDKEVIQEMIEKDSDKVIVNSNTKQQLKPINQKLASLHGNINNTNITSNNNRSINKIEEVPSDKSNTLIKSQNSTNYNNQTSYNQNDKKQSQTVVKSNTNRDTEALVFEDLYYEQVKEDEVITKLREKKLEENKKFEEETKQKIYLDRDKKRKQEQNKKPKEVDGKKVTFDSNGGVINIKNFPHEKLPNDFILPRMDINDSKEERMLNDFMATVQNDPKQISYFSDALKAKNVPLLVESLRKMKLDYSINYNFEVLANALIKKLSNNTNSISNEKASTMNVVANTNSSNSNTNLINLFGISKKAKSDPNANVIILGKPQENKKDKIVVATERMAEKLILNNQPAGSNFE